MEIDVSSYIAANFSENSPQVLGQGSPPALSPIFGGMCCDPEASRLLTEEQINT
jgi:hypothetical protein